MKKEHISLDARYKLHHDMKRTFLEWVGLVGVIAFPAFYLVRLAGILPMQYDDLRLRVIDTVLCLFLALRHWWPERLKPYYLAYSYFTVIFCLSFTLTFTTLHNGGATIAAVNMVIGTALIILLADWRNAVIMIVVGYAASLGLYVATAPNPHIPTEFLVWWIPLASLIVVVGALSKYGDKQAEIHRVQLIYASLAASIAHEMRTPFTQLRSALDVIAMELPMPDEEEEAVATCTREQVTAMAGAVGAGQNAIARGLQSIDVTLQQLEPNPFDTSRFKHHQASHCVEKAMSEYAFETHAERQRVSVQLKSDFLFNGDETVLVMVMFNLLKNALYYFPLRADAVLTISIDGETNQIVVRDTGPGIDSQLIKHLFGDFQTAGKAEGTGLGLAFCKRALLAFGGDITCDSTIGEFTEFTLTFPVVTQEEIDAAHEAVMAHARTVLAGKNILVVDDDAFLRKATMKKLSGLGCRFDEALNGAMALGAVAEGRIDLIIMDINMPVLDGYETTRRIRRGVVPGHTNVAILGYSSESNAVARVRTKQAGMNALLAKPCTTIEMVQAVVEAMEASAAHEAPAIPALLVGKTVLLADDSSVNRAIVKAYLMALGVQVIEASHGGEVLQAIQAGARPDVILMDMNMPGMGGIETTQQLRAMPAPMTTLPVVAITSNASQKHMAAAQAAGMNGFLTKPVGVAVLRAELMRLLETDSPRMILPKRRELLDKRRIRSFNQLGGDDLLQDFLVALASVSGRLEEAADSEDRSLMVSALHSLVGLTGEAGAVALFEAAAKIYRPMSEGKWPDDNDWLEEIRDLIQDTRAAVHDYHRETSVASQALRT